MRYRIWDEDDDWLALESDGFRTDEGDLVHVFRDDELDELADTVSELVADGFEVDAAVVVALRNHTRSDA